MNMKTIITKSILIFLLPGLATSLTKAQHLSNEVTIRIKDIYKPEDGGIQIEERELSGKYTEEDINTFLEEETVNRQLQSRRIEVDYTGEDGNRERRRYYRKFGEDKRAITMQIQEEDSENTVPFDSDEVMEKLADRFREFNFTFPDFPEFDMPNFQLDRIFPDIKPGEFPGFNLAPRARLGVTVDTEDGIGASIKEVMPESPAEKFGLQKGDIITGIDGENIKNGADLTSVISKKAPGDEVLISILREGNPFTVVVVLEEGPKLLQGTIRTFPRKEELKLDQQWPWNKNKDNKSLLGVGVQEMTNYNGLKVVRVDEGSPAAVAGIQVDDVIIKFDKHKVESANHLKSLLEDKSGETVKMELRRNGKKLKTVVQLQSKHTR